MHKDTSATPSSSWDCSSGSSSQAGPPEAVAKTAVVWGPMLVRGWDHERNEGESRIVQRKTSNCDSATQSLGRPTLDNASQSHPSTESSVEPKSPELHMPLSLSHRRGLPGGHDLQHSSCEGVYSCRPSAATELFAIGYCSPRWHFSFASGRTFQCSSQLAPFGWGTCRVTRGFHCRVGTFTPPLL